MAFKDRFREARKARKLSQGDIAEENRVTPQAVSGWERGTEMPSIDKLTTIARQVGRTVDWLLDGDPDQFEPGAVTAPGRKIPVIGYVLASGETHFLPMAAGEFDEIRATSQDPEHAVAVQIRGTSLGRLFDRWYAIYDDVRHPLTEDLIGQLCVVGLDDERVLIKKIERDGKKFDLVSNTDDEPRIKNVTIEWAAKVTNIRAR